MTPIRRALHTASDTIRQVLDAATYAAIQAETGALQPVVDDLIRQFGGVGV